MPTYLYCVVPTATPGELPEPPAGLRGIDRYAVRVIPATLGALWVSTMAAAPSPTAQRALDHNAVCDAALVVAGTVLPARFGETFASDAALCESIEARREVLSEAARRVAGAVEMVIAIPVAPSAAAPRGSAGATDADAPHGMGQQYLERLAAPARASRASLNATEPVRERLREALRPLLLAETLRVRLAVPAAVIVSHLIRREMVARYRGVVATIDGEEEATGTTTGEGNSDGRRVLVSGPSAPYSFVAASGGGSFESHGFDEQGDRGEQAQ